MQASHVELLRTNNVAYKTALGRVDDLQAKVNLLEATASAAESKMAGFQYVLSVF